MYFWLEITRETIGSRVALLNICWPAGRIGAALDVVGRRLSINRRSSFGRKLLVGRTSFGDR
jgi:hypothetical protein